MWTGADTAAEQHYYECKRVEELMNEYKNSDNEDLKLIVKHLEKYMNDADKYYEEMKRLRPYEYDTEQLIKYVKQLESYKSCKLMLEGKNKDDIKKIIDRNRKYYYIDKILEEI